MREPLPDWRLPKGIARELWDHLQDAELAEEYDQRLLGSSLLRQDQLFVAKHCRQPGRVVDLGCGTGRSLLPLAQRGFWTLGVDLSEPMLRKTGQKAAASAVTVRRLQANLCALDCVASESFAYALCLFSTLGMVLGPQQRCQVVAHVARLLRPGGLFLLHVHNLGFNLWDRAGRRWLLADLARRLLRRPGAGDRPLLTSQRQSRLALHHFTRREVVRLLAQAGFQMVEIQPVSWRDDGRLRWPWCFSGLRAYGYLIAARRPVP